MESRHSQAEFEPRLLASNTLKPPTETLLYKQRDCGPENRSDFNQGYCHKQDHTVSSETLTQSLSPYRSSYSSPQVNLRCGWLLGPSCMHQHMWGASREAGLSTPWILSPSLMLKFSPRLGGCSKTLKAVGHFGRSFLVLETMRSSKDCLRLQNPFCLLGCCSGFPEKPRMRQGQELGAAGWLELGGSSFLPVVPVWETASATLRSRRRVGVSSRDRELRIQLYPLTCCEDQGHLLNLSGPSVKSGDCSRALRGPLSLSHLISDI